MTDFEIQTNDIENVVYQKFNRTTTNIGNLTANLINQKNSLIDCTGNSIRYITNDLQTVISNIEKCRKQLVEEENTLRSIVDSVVRYETSAYGIISGENVSANTSAETASSTADDGETVFVSKEDWGKNARQFKYYSQRTENTKMLYDQLLKWHTVGDMTVSRDFYDTLKHLFLSMVFYDDKGGTGYVYSNVEYAGEWDTKTDWKNPVNFEASAEESAVEYVFASGTQDETVEYTLKVATTNGTVEVALDMFSNGIENLEEALKDLSDTSNVKATLIEAGINVKGELKGIELTKVNTRRLTENEHLYNEVKITIGELYVKAGANAGINATGADAGVGYKLGAVAAKIETKTGVITNDYKVTAGGGATAGVEIGAEWGGEDGTEISIGAFSISGDWSDGFDYYTWK